jgi:hypothetical protein
MELPEGGDKSRRKEEPLTLILLDDLFSLQSPDIQIIPSREEV